MAAFLPHPSLRVPTAATGTRRAARALLPLEGRSSTVTPNLTATAAAATTAAATAAAATAAGTPVTPGSGGSPRPRTRRAVLAAVAAVAAAAATTAATAGRASAAVAPSAGGAPPPPAAAADEDRRPPFVTLPSGVRVQEIAVGEGKEVTDGSVVSLQYVLRRPNGYFVDASYGFDRLDLYTYTAGSGNVVAGFDDAVRGMAPGGRRRFVVPPRVGYVAGVGAGKPGPIPPGWGERRALASHIGEDLIFEVRVVRVK